jgi:hypothetical protein
MRILFDHGTPPPLIPFLEGHTVTKAKDMGWERLVNGELLSGTPDGLIEGVAPPSARGRPRLSKKGPVCGLAAGTHGIRVIY